jgi:hypothetical protein
MCIDVNIAILQRVVSASVTVDKQLISSIGKGVLVFAAVSAEDTRKDVESMASKVLKLRMWPDEAGGTVRRPRTLRLLSSNQISNGSKASKIFKGKFFVVRTTYLPRSASKSLLTMNSLTIYPPSFNEERQ